MKYLVIILLTIFASKAGFGQIGPELMNNGGFEIYDNTVVDYPTWSINYALDWHKLNNTPDLFHPSTITNPVGGPQYFPHSGVGHANFIFTHYEGSSEYFYGSTQPLTAGVQYTVSFWVQSSSNNFPSNQVGLKISNTVPTPMQLNPYVQTVVPDITYIPTWQYEQVIYCFTPTVSGVHYLTFGFFQAIPEEQQQIHYFVLDDVSVKASGNILASSSLSINSSVACIGSTVLIDGSGSTNETAYEWDVYQIISGNEILVSNGAMQNGQAGQLNMTAVFASAGHVPLSGNCYRVYLTTYGGCPDKEYVDFCYIYPTINFITDGSPVCENIPVDLQVTGDNGWTYTWNTGQSGVGLKTVSVTPTVGNSTYTVTVTTPQGCTSTKTITLVVNSQDNLPPWMDGINGTGEYTYYVNQGDAVFFNSLLSNDHLNENITITTSTTIPPGYAIITPTGAGTLLSLSWATSLSTPTGEYHYYLTADDKNSCGAGINTFDFRIIVVCDQCPVCLNYEDRSPFGTPLPAETKAGKCIEAGLSQTVSTGEANVLFQAGAYILEGPNFEAGPGYEGVIEPSTCVTDCEDCCNDWTGFTYDELPNPFYMNFADGYPTNDFIQITDTYHPFCAFNAKGYSFEILDNHQNLMNNGVTEYHATACCEFESPAPENPIPHSSIWWDGNTVNMWGNTVRVNDGVYTYKLILYGCNGEELLLHGYINVYGTSGMAQASGGQQADAGLDPEEQRKLDEVMAEHEQLEKTLNLFPNPATDVVQITGTESGDVFYQVFDDKGIMLSRKEKAVNQSFSLAKYSSGTYYIRVYSGTTYAVRKVVKI